MLFKAKKLINYLNVGFCFVYLCLFSINSNAGELRSNTNLNAPPTSIVSSAPFTALNLPASSTSNSSNAINTISSIAAATKTAQPIQAASSAPKPLPILPPPSDLDSFETEVESIDVFEVEGMTDNQDPLAKPDESIELVGPPPPLDTPYDRDIWQRVRNGFAMPELDDPRIKTQTNFYGQYPKFVAKVAERAGQYLFYILEELEKRNMPTELALLPFVESSFNPEAVSVAKAAGMWQFIPSTGKFYGLDQNLFYDERRDVLASTQAALDYLQRLHDQFGDWFLALASYNWGENAVARAQAKNMREGKPTDYLSLNMPNETRNYVPRLLAIKALIANPSHYQIQLPDVANEPHFIAVYINRDIDVDRAAKLADISLAEFRSLNPSLRKPVIIASAKNPILIPEDKADLFVQNLEKEQGVLSSWSIYTLSAKETLMQVAERFDISPALLASINNISTKSKIHAGSTLLVPRGKGASRDISQEIIQNARVVLEAAPRLNKSNKPNKSAKNRSKTKTSTRSKNTAKTPNQISSKTTSKINTKTSTKTTINAKKPATKNTNTQQKTPVVKKSVPATKNTIVKKSTSKPTASSKKSNQTSDKKDPKK